MQPEPLIDVPGAPVDVSPSYRHSRKLVAPAEPQRLGGTLLKWYHVHPQGGEVPLPVAEEARAFVGANLAATQGGLGFVILHRCGASGYFLIVSTWRNDNELWEAAWYRSGEHAAFESTPRDGQSVPAFCVWELVPVWHEQQAWVRFLESARDDAALRHWLSDCYAGVA